MSAGDARKRLHGRVRAEPVGTEISVSYDQDFAKPYLDLSVDTTTRRFLVGTGDIEKTIHALSQSCTLWWHEILKSRIWTNFRRHWVVLLPETRTEIVSTRAVLRFKTVAFGNKALVRSHISQIVPSMRASMKDFPHLIYQMCIDAVAEGNAKHWLNRTPGVTSIVRGPIMLA